MFVVFIHIGVGYRAQKLMASSVNGEECNHDDDGNQACRLMTKIYRDAGFVLAAADAEMRVWKVVKIII